MVRGARPDRSATMTIPEASSAIGFGRSLGYELAAQDKFPCRVIKAGRRYIVPRIEVERLLGLAPEQDDHTAGQ
jgi:hypothetical protein